MSGVEPTVDISLGWLRGFIAGDVTIQELYDCADRLRQWLQNHREQTPETNQIRVIEGLLSVACTMSRIGETANRPHAEVFSGQVDSARAHQDLLRGLDGKQACPFCGAVSERTSSPCQRCGMDNTPEARKATKARIGPWYVLQARNPAAPGMRFETLLGFVRKGRVRARSVVRGPTTHQLWKRAAVGT